jgi:hypothetical protein
MNVLIFFPNVNSTNFGIVEMSQSWKIKNPWSQEKHKYINATLFTVYNLTSVWDHIATIA